MLFSGSSTAWVYAGSSNAEITHFTRGHTCDVSENDGRFLVCFPCVGSLLGKTALHCVKKERPPSLSPTLRRNNRAALKEAWGIGRRKRLGLMWALQFIHMCSRDSSLCHYLLLSERTREWDQRPGCGDKLSFWEPLDYHKDPGEYWEGSGRAAGGTEDLKYLADRSWVLLSEDLWAKALLIHCHRQSCESSAHCHLGDWTCACTNVCRTGWYIDYLIYEVVTLHLSQIL